MFLKLLLKVRIVSKMSYRQTIASLLSYRSSAFSPSKILSLSLPKTLRAALSSASARTTPS